MEGQPSCVLDDWQVFSCKKYLDSDMCRMLLLSDVCFLSTMFAIGKLSSILFFFEFDREKVVCIELKETFVSRSEYWIGEGITLLFVPCLSLVELLFLYLLS